MFRRLLLSAALWGAALLSTAIAQDLPKLTCGTTVPEGYVPPHAADPEAFAAFERTFAAEQAKQRRRGTPASLRRVPTTVWIMRRSDGTGGLPTAQLLEAYRQANVPYVDAGLEFVIGAVNYVDDDTFYDLGDQNEAALVATHYDAQRLNVYFTGTVRGGDFCGYAWFPGTEFTGGTDRAEIVVMANGCAANGSTFAHEFGHSYGLLHTHEPFLGRELVDGSNCASAGDLICDTPADPGLSGLVDGRCDYTGSAVDANGEPYVPDPRNIMSYSPPRCQDFISPQQLAVIAFNAQTAPDRQFADDQPALALFALTEVDGRASCDGSQRFRLQASPGQDAYGWDVRADGIVDLQGPSNEITYTSSTLGSIDFGLYAFRYAPQASSAVSAQVDLLTTTPPSARVPLPLSQSFDSGFDLYDLTANSANLRWETQSGPTPSRDTGPSGGYLPGGGFGGQYAYFETSASLSHTATSSLRTPCITLPPGASAEVELYYHMYGAAIGELHFDIERNSGEIVKDVAPALVGQQQTASSDPWRPMRFTIPQFGGETVQLRLRAVYGDSWRGDIAVDAISIQSFVPVPVELAAFTAEPSPDGSLLRWSAASEVNVDRYEVQRSTSADANFASLGKQFAENAPTGADYAFTDGEPIEGTNYYRLRMIDLDGTEEYSETVAVEWTSIAEALALYPNPATGGVTVRGLRQNERAVLRDAVGRIVVEGAAGENQLDLSDWPAGFYTVEVTRAGGVSETLPLVVR